MTANKDGSGGDALRAQDWVRLPRLWVPWRAAQMIMDIARPYKDEHDRIKREARE